MWGVGHFWTQLNALDWKLAYKMDLQYLKLSFVCDISRPL